MKSSLAEKSLEELRASRKTLRSVGIIVCVLAVLYVGFMVYVALAGLWTQTHTMGVVPLLCLVAATVPSFSQRAQIDEEIRRRSGSSTDVGGA